MSTLAIRIFNQHQGNIKVRPGFNVLPSGRIIEYPGFEGDKEGMRAYYNQIAEIKQWHPWSLLNTFHVIMAEVEYL